MALLLLGSWGFRSAVGHACEDPATLSDLEALVGAAHLTFGLMDASAFELVRERAQRTLPCVVEPLDVHSAAAYHAMMGLDAFIARDNTAVDASFRAAIWADPQYALSTEALPTIHPLHARMAAAGSMDPGPDRRLPGLGPDHVLANGRDSPAVPAALDTPRAHYC